MSKAYTTLALTLAIFVVAALLLPHASITGRSVDDEPDSMDDQFVGPPEETTPDRPETEPEPTQQSTIPDRPEGEPTPPDRPEGEVEIREGDDDPHGGQPIDESTDVNLAAQQKNAIDAKYSQTMFANTVDQLIGNTVNKYLGPFAYGWIDDMCKDKWESSEPESTTPQEYTSDPGVNTMPTVSEATAQALEQNPDALNNPTLIPGACERSSVTTMNAYGQKNGDSFLVSYVVQACSQGWNQSAYSVTLKGDEEVSVYSGTVSYGEVISNQKTIESQKDFQKVCITIVEEPQLTPFCTEIRTLS